MSAPRAAPQYRYRLYGRRLDVLCEKPLGITIKACRVMAETADRTGKVLSTAVSHRRQPGQRVAHWVFHEPLIGEPLSFFHHHCRPPELLKPPTNSFERVRWRQDKPGRPAADWCSTAVTTTVTVCATLGMWKRSTLSCACLRPVAIPFTGSAGRYGLCHLYL
ncbi:MAG: hypothetical protein R3E79_20350 [Caldilineaceae bacterium]